jgi:hypothetical protein
MVNAARGMAVLTVLSLQASCSLFIDDLPSGDRAGVPQGEADAGLDGNPEGGADVVAEAAVEDAPIDAAEDREEEDVRDGSAESDAAAAEPVVLAVGQDGPADLAVDDRYVYWVNQSVGAEGTVQRMPLDGSEDPVVIAEGQFMPTRIVVHGEDLYWIDRGGGLWTARVPGDMPQRVGMVSGSDCWGLGVGDGRLFMTTMHSVEQFSLPSGPLETWAAEEHDALALTVAGGVVYWTNDAPGGAVRRSLVDGQPTTLATGQGSSSGIAVDGTHVYWTSWDHGTVSRIPREGGEIERLSSGEYYPSGVAVDDTHVYWLTEGSYASASGSLFRMPREGGLGRRWRISSGCPSGSCWMTRTCTG